MTPSFLSTKRHNTRQHPVARSLRAVTSRRKKQRVAATASHGDFDDYHDSDSGSRIARVLTIIFFIHVVAIGLIYVHQVYLKRSLPAATASDNASTTETNTSQPSTPDATPRLSSGEAPYIVARGDNYTRIAAAHDVDVADLRRANDNAEIRPGLLLKIPPRRIVATEPPEVAALRTPAPTPTPTPTAPPAAHSATHGLVPANDPAHREPRGNQTEIPRATPVGTRNHTVQAGETIWRISQKYEVDKETIMKLNNITDPRRIQVGHTLQIP